MANDLDEQFDDEPEVDDQDTGDDDMGEEPGQESGKSVVDKARGLKDTYDSIKQKVEAAKKTKQAIETAEAAKTAGILASPTTWWVIGIVLVLGLLTVLVIFIFQSGINKINSLAGGSIFIPADYNSSVDRQIVANLFNKMSGLNPAHKLVIEDHEPKDIDWKFDETSGKTVHELDIRLLQTLDYLTDRHRYVEIGMLKKNAPTLLRSGVRMKPKPIDNSGDTGNVKQKETFSAFHTGQGMAITAVDYSKLDYKDTLLRPIHFDDQETLSEKTIRPIWEELTFSAGFLDENSAIYKMIAGIEIGDPAIYESVNEYLYSVQNDQFNIYEEAYSKVNRIVELLDRIDSTLGLADNVSMDPRTNEYFHNAKTSFAALKNKIEGTPIISKDIAEDRIRILGNNTDLIANGARNIYKATQVANMVGWNEVSGMPTKWNRAYEARNKIRQVIKELVEMPRVTAEAYKKSLQGVVGPLTMEQIAMSKFSKNLVVKQIITFSPEDDLDNGLMNLDVFPKGITAVDVGGVGIEGTSTTTQTDENGTIISGATIGDGVVDYADIQFSHKPIDNGVFSKNGTWYVFIGMPESTVDKVMKVLDIFFTLGMPASSPGHNLFGSYSGDVCIAVLNEFCRPARYKGFLHVAF